MGHGRPLCKTILLSLLVLVGAASSSQAQHGSWLMEYLSGWYSEPAMINAKQPTTLYLWGWFPYRCGEVANAEVVDPGHVQFDLRPGPACSDTVTVWRQGFNLGLLPAGYHTIHIRRLYYASATDSGSLAQASFTVYVEPDSTPPPPPPPPPPHGSWLLEYLSGWYSEPSMINAKQPTRLSLWGWFPYYCGQVTEARVLHQGHVELTLRPGPACDDTVTVWHQGFDLGLLPAGWNSLQITRKFYAQGADSAQVDAGRFSFYVEPDSVPPPPGPQCREHGSMLIRGLSGWYTDPPTPTDLTPTSLMLWGWFPYECGRVADAAVLAPDRVRLTLSPGAACSDTAVTWSQAFGLGVLRTGWHTVRVEMQAVGDSCDTSRVRTASLTFLVTDEVVSPSVPNPFVTETRFTVTNGEPGPVDVGIHDLAGRRVATLHHGDLPKGSFEFRWDGKRADGSDAAIGIYFSRVAFTNRVVSRRLVMIPRR